MTALLSRTWFWTTLIYSPTKSLGLHHLNTLQPPHLSTDLPSINLDTSYISIVLTSVGSRTLGKISVLPILSTIQDCICLCVTLEHYERKQQQNSPWYGWWCCKHRHLPFRSAACIATLPVLPTIILLLSIPAEICASGTVDLKLPAMPEKSCSLFRLLYLHC